MFLAENGPYFLGIGALVGTIVGVGMFGLPFVAAQSGVIIALLYLLVFGVLMGLMHYLYFEVALHTKEKHRFTGYVGYYLGPRWKLVTLVQGLISLWGTLLLYTVVGGEFLAIMGARFLPSSLGDARALFGILFFIVSAAIVLKGSYAVGTQELIFSLPLLLLIVVIFLKAAVSPVFSLRALSTVNTSHAIMPYGITLFALAGFSVVPTLHIILQKAMAKGRRPNFPAIVFWGTLIPAFLYALFIVAVVGVNGSATTPDALSGLGGALGNGIVYWGALLGILAIYTSFIAIGDELKNTFINDYRVSPFLAALFAFLPPLLLYIFQIRNFILIANIVGSLMGGYAGVMILLLWQAMRKKLGAPPVRIVWKCAGWGIAAIFLFASCYSLVETFISVGR